MSYFKNISYALRTTRKGLALTLKYFFSARFRRNSKSVAAANYFDGEKGTFTVQYPNEEIPVPDHGRYKLHNEIDDCIVCDKCAKICPVDCIDIEPIRAVEEYGKTSDGTPLRIHAAKFDIDMAKCCFCGLCTVVCPTECLTMTNEFDYSTADILDHNFSFGKMTEKEITEKRNEFEEFQAKKETIKSNPSSEKIKPVSLKKTGAKPVLKPRPTPKRK
ncbi:MAG: 4Fe-4S binding protein [Cyclobacteriaceae bacterium]